MTAELKKTTFQCPKCSEIKVIETIGQVVGPPKCQRCGLKMTKQRSQEKVSS